MKKTQLKKFSVAPRWYVRKELGAEASIVLIYLMEVDCLQDEEWFQCSNVSVVNATGISKMTVMKCMNRLSEFRYIERRMGMRNGNSINEYRICYEVINAVEKPSKQSTVRVTEVSEGGLKLDRSKIRPVNSNKDDDPGIPDPDDRSENFIKTSSTDVPEYLPDDVNNKKKKYKKEKTDSQFSGSDRNDTTDNNSAPLHGETDKNETDMIDYENQPEWLEHQSDYIDGPVTTVKPMNECVTALLNTIEACIAKVKSATDIENVRIQRRNVDKAFIVFKQSSCGHSASERQIAFIESKLNNFTRIAGGKERLYGGAIQMTRDELSQQMRQDGYEPHEVKSFMSQQRTTGQPYNVTGMEDDENQLSEITIKTLKAKFEWEPGTGNAPLASFKAHQRTNAPSDDKLSTGQN